MDEKEKVTNCEDLDKKMPKLEFIGTLGCDDDDDNIVIPVAEYKYLIRCEAAVQLMDKLLDNFGEYSAERSKIMKIACEILRKEGPYDAE